MKIITTQRSVGRIASIMNRGTKRQRAKYRHAVLVLSGIIKTILCGPIPDPQDPVWREWARRERRRGSAVMSGLPERVKCPSWHGVKGLRGQWIIFF